MESALGVIPHKLKADGKTDNTAAIQAAIDAVSESGGTVYLPAGEYLVAGNLDLKANVALEGANTGPMSIGDRKGTILLATAGRDKEDAPPFIHMTNATAVRRLTIFYPEQKCEAIVPYPWTFQMEGFDTTIEEVTFINSYNGIRTGPANNVRHRIQSVVGTVLRRGIQIDFCTDIGRVENVQFHCHWWSAPAFGGSWEPVYEYMWKNLEAFVFARTDWEYMTNNFVFPAKIGWRFIESEFGSANGHLTACGADSTQTALQVDAIQPMGLLITGGQFVSFMGDEPVQVRVSDSSSGSVRFVNCAFWGASRHNAMVDGNGFVSFSDCYFSSGSVDAYDVPLILARSGRLQVHNSTFATSHIGVELGPEVKHAIIQGNNGVSGLRVVNNASKTIISNNEEDPVDLSGDALQHFRIDIGRPDASRYIAEWNGSEPAGEWADAEGNKRWSRDESLITVPVEPGTTYTVLLDVLIPGQAITPESGLYLGETCIVPLVEPGTGVRTGILPPVEEGKATLRLRVKGWVPAETDGSTDTRTLGVAVRSVTLRAEGAAPDRVYDAVTGDWIEGETSK